MKKVTILGLILLGLGFSPLLVRADVIPNNSHPLDRCAKIINLNEFPGILIVGYVTGPMVANYGIEEINNNECMKKGYKFNTMDVYWNTEDSFHKIIKDNLLATNIEVYGGYVENKNSLIKENVEYSLLKSLDGKISLQKTKIISEYNNGTPDKIETFSVPLNDKKIEVKKDISDPIVINNKGNSDVPNNNDVPAQPVKRSFWHRIACFFGIIKNC